MALINCPECGKEISESSDACIHCGFVLKSKVASEKTKKEKKKFNIIFLVIVVVVGLAILGGGGYYFYQTITIPQHNYDNAIAVLNSGDYDSAIKLFSEMDGYKDSSDKVLEAYYFKGMKLLEEEQYEEAISAFKSAGIYKDALSQVSRIESIVSEQKKKAEEEAARQEKINLLAASFKSCIGGRATLSSDGTELVIDGEDEYDLLSVWDIHDTVDKLGLPSTLYDEMTRTTSLMGKQTQTYNGFQVSWSYHPKNGLDAYFKIID